MRFLRVQTDVLRALQIVGAKVFNVSLLTILLLTNFSGITQVNAEQADSLQLRSQSIATISKPNNNYQAPVFTRPEARRGVADKENGGEALGTILNEKNSSSGTAHAPVISNEIAGQLGDYPTTNRIECWGGTSGYVCEEDNNYYVRQTITKSFSGGGLATANLKQHLFPDGFGSAPSRPVTYRVSVEIHEEYATSQNRINSSVRLRRVGNYGYTYFSSSEGLVSGYGTDLTVSSQFEFTINTSTIFTDYLQFDLLSAADWPASGYYTIVLEAWSDVVPPQKIPELSVVSTATGNFCTAYEGTQESEAGPINTRTGGYDYFINDISIPTSVGKLSFKREYTSLSIDKATTLSAGWTHNHDLRLIFPSDPEGQPDKILFKADTSNRYIFIINGDGTYSPYPGLCMTLVENAASTYTLKDGSQRTYTFDATGQLQTYADAHGNEWDYYYNASNNLDRVVADGGTKYLSLQYDTQGRIETVSDHTGRSVSYQYDANGDLASFTDVLQETWTYEYHSTQAHLLTRVASPGDVTVERTEFYPDGRAWRQFDGEDNLIVELIYNSDGTTTIKDALGNIKTHIYDSRGTLIEQENAVGALQEKQYDTNFRPSTIIDESGNSTQLTWSTDGINLTGVVDAAGGQTAITYDSLNNPTSVVDPLGNLSSYSYAGTLLTSTTDALDNQTSYTYTTEGFLETVTDPLGNTTSYTYDQFGQRTSMTDALGNVWGYSYDDLGRLTDTTDPLGRVTHNDYDAAGRLIRSTQNYDPGRLQNDDNQWNIVTEYDYDVRGNQISVTDTYGRTTTYEYDAAGRLIFTTDPDGNISHNTYNEAGQLVSSTDPLDRTTNYAYDASGRLTSTTDPLGNVTRTAYNLDGTVASTTDALGSSTSYQYDTLKRVVAFTTPDSGVTRSEYDAAGNMVASVDSLGNRTTYEYDALGRLIKLTDPLNGVTEHFYDEVGNRVQTIDPRDNATTYTYDSANRQTAVTDSLGNVTSYEYDDLGRRTAVVDANGNRTTYSYDSLDRIVSVTDPLGRTTSTNYDALGQALSRTDSNGKVTIFQYDSLGRLVSLTDPLDGVTTFEYDAVGNQLSVTDPNGHVSSTSYDALNRPVVVTDPLGNASVTTGYDASGQVTAVNDALGNTTTFGYDAAGRQTSVTDPLGNVTQNGFDAAGRLINVTDANGVVTHFEYDALGRLTAVVENYRPGFQPTAEINIRTEYTYDANGNRLTITDGNDHVTTFTYDTLNRLFQEADPLGNTWQYGYDAVGNRVSTYDANNVLVTYTYDEANQLTDIDYPGTSEDVSFTYDTAGRRASMTDGLGTTTWAYDDLNRPTAISDPFGATVGYSYDAVSNRTGLTYPDGKTVSYAYDSANRLTNVTDWNNQITQYTYDPLGRLLSALRPNGVDSAYSYDAAGRLLALQHTLSGTGTTGDATLSSFQYTYDNVGNRTQAIETTQSGQTGPTVTVTVTETSGLPMAGKTVYAFSGDTYTGYNKVTDADGQVSITLPEGNYRFRVDVDGTQIWSAADNHCTIGECAEVMLSVPEAVLVSVQDTDGTPKEGMNVYAFDGTVYTNFNGTTDANGQASLRLPQGSYRFRVDFNGTQFWSEAENHCDVPSCTLVSIDVTVPVAVRVEDDLGMPREGLTVYAFDGTTYTGYNKTTDANGQAVFTLPQGDYRFRADEDGTQFWSGENNHCTTPGCLEASITISLPTVVTVLDSDGLPQSGVSVYAFDGDTYTNFNAVTDANGEAALTLPPGAYRFRADYNGTQFWSAESNHCAVPGCVTAEITVTTGTTVTVQDSNGQKKEGVSVYVFDGTSYTSFNGTTDANGEVTFTLPVGSYRFRADFNGTQFWSDSQNHCTVPGCVSAEVTVTTGTTVTVQDTGGLKKEGVKVYVFDGTTYTNFNGTTNSNGKVTFTLPVGSYRFRADYNGTQFWSDTQNHCTVPGCGEASITVTPAVMVTVQDSDETPKAGLKVYVFNGTSYTGFNGTTDANGQVFFTLTEGSYRFRADMNGTQFWSDSQNHCTIPGCDNVVVSVTKPLTVTVSDTEGTPKSGLKVYAFDGSSYTGYNKTTDGNGEVVFTLPAGSYRFRSDFNGIQFWSAESNHCDLPGCESAEVTVTVPLTVAVQDGSGAPQSGVKVYAFDGATYTGYNKTSDENGETIFTLPLGSYRFRADYQGDQYWSNTQNDCDIPGCVSDVVIVGSQATATAPATSTPVPTATETPLSPTPTPITSGGGIRLASLSRSRVQQAQTGDVVVTVQDTDGTVKEGLTVYVFDGSTYTGLNATTDANGQATFDPPAGDYRFRADFNGTQFWSDTQNHCTVPGCTEAAITVTVPVTVTVDDTDGVVMEGLNVYAFDGTTYTNFNGTTDASGQVTFTLPEGSYRFRADFNGTQFWSGENNHCTLPGCENVAVTVTKPLTVTVQDTDGTPKEGLKVYAFDGTTYTNFNSTTDANGQAVFTLPEGNYRFRADFNGTQFWSDAQNHCNLPGCESAAVVVTKPLTVTVTDGTGQAYPDVNVYAFTDSTYTGFNGVTDENGNVVFTLPQGAYRFRADYDGVQFWSSLENDCTLPGCTSIDVLLPGGMAETTVTIDYTYDSLYRLAEANYDTGDYYQYTYDSVGNRLTQESSVNGLPSTVTYAYDIANRLTDVNGLTYTWDANGNLLNDSVNTYAYDYANRLTSLTGPSVTTTYNYSGLGDRLQETVNGDTTTFTMDLNTGLTQALSDGTYTYLYGIDRIAQVDTTAEYFLGDALNSVRQMTDPAGDVTYAQTYDPYGVVTQTNGTSQTFYGYTNEYTSQGLIYLRSRWYDPASGRFPTKDSWQGNYNRPLSLNRWMYVEGDPVNLVDPTGMIPEEKADEADEFVEKLRKYNIHIEKDWGYRVIPVPSSSLPPFIMTGFLYSVGCEWEEGNWRTVRELRLVKQAVTRIINKMRDSEFRSAMGTVKIRRWTSFYEKRSFARAGLISLNNDAFRSDNYSRYVVAHEFGHVWDARNWNRLSNEMSVFIGTRVCRSSYCRFDIDSGREYAPGRKVDPYAGNNAKEDWAEAFASFVYPGYYPSYGPKYRGIGSLRKQFVKDKINGIH